MAQRSNDGPPAVHTKDIRIVEIDIFRGVAVLGIYWINVVIFAFPHGVYAWPTIVGEAHAANTAAWAFSEVFIEGTMRGLFSMLFGASALIFLDEAKLNASGGLQVVDYYYRRNLLLILFGLIHAYLLLAQWDLLYVYGLLALFLFPLRNLKAKTLLIAGIALLAFGDLQTLRANIGAEDEQVTRSLTGSELTEYLVERRETMLESMQPELETYVAGYWDIFNHQLENVAEQQSTGMYNDHVFDVGGMMLIGIALMKLGFFNGQRSLRAFIFLSVACYAVGILMRGYDAHQDWLFDFDTDRRDPWSIIPYNLGRLAITLGHVGLIGALMKSKMLKVVSCGLAAVGRLALTNYVMQSVISALIFFGFGLGLYARFEPYHLIGICFAVWAFQVATSVIYLNHYRIGPLEWVWRSLIYGRPQPISRKAECLAAPSPA